MPLDDEFADASRGFYQKFHVTRTDGQSERGKKHSCCNYFVLDLDCDPHAIPALKAYAKSCRDKFPQLAADLETLIEERE